MSYFSTLGYVPNTLLDLYKERFIYKLEDIWRKYIDMDVPVSEYLLHPDVHSILLELQNPQKQNTEEDVHKLRQDYRSFQLGEGNLISVNQEELIQGTNISLTRVVTDAVGLGSNHPDHKKDNIGISFGNISEEEWRDIFRRVFTLLEKVSPGFSYEIQGILRKIIPFDISHGGHNSGSFSTVIGYILMSYPVDIDDPELVILEALLHEYNHNKINLILQTEPLILNDRKEVYYSPYRPDPRHIYGIYLGVHALAGAYWVILNAHLNGIRVLNHPWQEKSVTFVLKNGISLQVLEKYAVLTPVGKNILDEIKMVHKECLSYIRDSKISPEIIQAAKKANMVHYTTLKSQYPFIQA